jgi:hypothetical protein
LSPQLLPESLLALLLLLLEPPPLLALELELLEALPDSSLQRPQVARQ